MKSYREPHCSSLHAIQTDQGNNNRLKYVIDWFIAKEPGRVMRLGSYLVGDCSGLSRRSSLFRMGAKLDAGFAFAYS